MEYNSSGLPEPLHKQTKEFREFHCLESCLKKLEGKGNYNPLEVDREDIEVYGELLFGVEKRWTTIMNYIWGKWFASISPKNEKGKPVFKGRTGWKKKIVDDLYGVGTFQAKSAYSKLGSLARVVERCPPDLWDYSRHWNFYELLSRLWIDPFTQLEWAKKPLYKGIMADMEKAVKDCELTVKGGF